MVKYVNNEVLSRFLKKSYLNENKKVARLLNLRQIKLLKMFKRHKQPKK